MAALYVRDGATFREASASAILERARQLMARRLRTGAPVLDRPERVREFLQLRLGHLEYEAFAVFFLCSHLRLIEYVELFRGTIDETSVHAREIVKEALARNAAALILVHNHPSGDPKPSEGDREITRHIKQALALVDIHVVDHLIVGESVFSFAEHGLL